MYSGYKSFIRYNICQYFLPACSWSWYSITISFEEQKFFILMKSSLSIGPFIDHAFSVVSKRCLPKSRSQNFSPMFYLRSFIVLAFIFTFIIYFCVIFCVLFKHGPNFIFLFAQGYPIVPVPFIEKVILSPLNCLCISVDN